MHTTHEMGMACTAPIARRTQYAPTRRRRRHGRARLALQVACAWTVCACAAGPERHPLNGVEQVELVRSGFQFVEGPVWRASARTLLFSDVPADTIWQMDATGEFTVFRRPSGGANGLARDHKGRLVACEQGNRRVTRTLDDGTIEVVAATFEGKRLNAPNDVVVRDDGTIYFTDPPFGTPAEELELATNNVFRIAPDGSLHVLWAGEARERPNGIALSPDQRRLYVSDSFLAVVRVFDLQRDGGSAGPPRTLAETSPVADGMAVDQDGNVWVTTEAGVQVFAPTGMPLGTLAVPRPPANCTFGGIDRRTLWITARNGLYRARVHVAGLP